MTAVVELVAEGSTVAGRASNTVDELERLIVEYLATKQLAKLTAEGYASTIRVALRTIGKRPGLVRKADLERYLKGLRTTATNRRQTSTLRGFFRFLAQSGHVDRDPSEGLVARSRGRGRTRRRVTPAGEPGSVRSLALEYVAGRRAMGELTDATADVIRYTLEGLAGSVGPGPAAEALTIEAVERWLAARPVASSTKRRQLSEVRTFCRWLVVRGHLPNDVTAWIKGPKQPRPPVRAQQEAAAQAILAACGDERDRLIVTLMLQLGLRCVEVARLQLGDVDLAAGVLQVEGKGGHWRILPVTAEAGEAIRSYLEVQPAAAGPLIRAYVPSPDGRRVAARRGVSAQTISKTVAGVCADAGVHRHAHDGATGHSLRHTCAVDMINAGADLRDVQTALGHVNLATTSRYIGLTGMKDLRRAMEGRRYGLAPRSAAEVVVGPWAGSGS